MLGLLADIASAHKPSEEEEREFRSVFLISITASPCSCLPGFEYRRIQAQLGGRENSL
jgi:hypothetical protein